jgi:hypothetical protein
VTRWWWAGYSRVGQHLKWHAAQGDIGKAAQLEGGAVEFAIQAHGAKASFFFGQAHQRFAVALQCGCQTLEQLGARQARVGCPKFKGVGSGTGGCVHLL